MMTTISMKAFIAFSLLFVQQGEAFLSVISEKNGLLHPYSSFPASFRPEAGLLYKQSTTGSELFLGRDRRDEEDDDVEMEERGSKWRRPNQPKVQRSTVVAGDFDNARDWHAGETLAHEFFEEVRARNEEGTLDVDVVIAKNRKRMNGYTGEIVVKAYRNAATAASVTTTATKKQAKQKRKLWPPIPASFDSPTPLTISGIVATVLLTGLWFPILACAAFVMYYHVVTAAMVNQFLPVLWMMGPF